MRFGLRSRLFLVSLALIGVAVIVAEVVVLPAMHWRVEERLSADAEARARLAAALAATSPLPADDGGWKALASSLSKAAGARVAIVRRGALVADSGEDARLRELLDREAHPAKAHAPPDLLTASAPLGGQGDLRLVVALPIAPAVEAVGYLHRLWLLAAAVAVVMAALLSSAAAQQLSRAVRGLANAAGRMAAGDLRVRTHVGGPDDLGTLGQAVDRLAGSLFSALGDLRTERDLLSAVLEAMSEGVLVVDADGRIEVFNPSLREMLLLTGEVKGRTPLEVIRNADLQGALDRARAGQASSIELEIGGLKPRRLLARALPLPAGGPRGQLAVIVDVTNVRRLETLRRELVANVSHELRTPVTAIRSAAETLSGALRSDPEAAPRFVEMIERNAERMQRLVDDLLDLARIESKELKLSSEPLELGPALDLALASVRPKAERRRIQLSWDAAQGLKAAADRRAFEQVVANLADNAAKYCLEGTRVRITAASSDGAVRVAVSDEGPGIEGKHLARLFERFYRIDPGRSRELGGTGLGLSIVKHLVEAMGGKVGVDSAPGKGSTFWFTLPAVEEVPKGALLETARG